MNIIYDHILVRYGELSTKGKNKKDFIKRLQHNVRNALKTFDKLEYKATHDRLYILLNGEDVHAIKDVLQHVFGISSFSFAVKIPSEIEEMKKTALHIAEAFQMAPVKFFIVKI